MAVEDERLSVNVPAGAAGMRLDRFLAELDHVGSRSAAEGLLRRDAVRVDGQPKAKSYRLAGGETVEVLIEREPPTLEAEEVDFGLVYEDDQLLVVDKPAGITVHPSAGHRHGTLVHGLLDHSISGGSDADRPGIVHRLDRDTSGLMVVARSPEAHRRLQRLVRRRTLLREYLALVRGIPQSRAGRIEAPIGRDVHDPTRHSLDSARPRQAVTHFVVEELLPAHTLLRVRLETGRTHQIRVHLAVIELPVSGDSVYGVPGDLGLNRQFLHAARLAFDHPFDERRLDLDSPLPADLARALEVARGSTG